MELDGKIGSTGLSFAELCADSRHFPRQAAFPRSSATSRIYGISTWGRMLCQVRSYPGLSG